VQRDPKDELPALVDLHRIGTLARVRKINRTRDGETYRVTLEGVERFEVDAVVQSDPYWRAQGHVADEVGANSDEANLLFEELRLALRPLAQQGNDGLKQILAEVNSPSAFADRIASGLDVDRER